MKIFLEELIHQQQAVKKIIDTFTGIEKYLTSKNCDNEFANNLIINRYSEEANIDIKMETGTGKTYVYTKMMYELHKKFGIFKFILVVPSPAIKEGAKNFLTNLSTKRHFQETYGNVEIEINIINKGDFNTTKSVVIIDEPHRFPRDKKNYKSIENLEPQMIVRFGATFPEVKKGTGKKAVYIKDYYRGRPQFELNAVDSFNQGLVKGIDIYYPNLTPEQAKNRYTIDSVKAKEIVLKKGKNKWTLGIGENLANIDSLFEGDLSYSGAKTLSNDLEISKGMDLLPGTFTTNYQELIINDAINQHFEHEINNFMRDNLKENFQPKVKTLSLFFIDSIRSYRNKEGWLKQTFERLLKVKLRKLIKEFEVKKLPREIEYLDFLRVTYDSLNSENQMVHAGYFGEDRGSGDEAIQAEVNDILKNKEKMLSFKDENGNWITRRFLFSKWTLREGWDNPNVFVIAKLRTSGSENSKIQEVGRGLRLPVDENGHRLTQDEFPSRLSFLIGYDEKDFAEKLIGEINSDVDVKLSEDKLTDEMINKIVEHRK